MGLYERIWKDTKNRTLLLSTIILLATLILAIIFASWDFVTAPNWLKGLYIEEITPEDFIATYNAGLTILTAFLVSIFYFFLLIALATLSEIRANLPSWGSFIVPVVISILSTWMITVIRPKGVGGVPNYNTAMQWTIFGILIGVIFLSTIYIFLTEPGEEDEAKEKDKRKGKEKSKKKD
ncbi:MAG: hypothetical protein GOP50_08545 [Candidatus Heimdallarchaeota archaeon]|nr:hypothetical protein [Candidatus Heimdallarchaeota archaeon]